MPVNTPDWVKDAVFYQVFPDRFARSGRVHVPGPLESWDAAPTTEGFKGGDLYGVADHLDHLVALGVNAIYLNPIFRSASNHRYHTDDYMAVDPMLGGDAALRHLLDQAHARGIRVVLDAVFNHTGRGHEAFHHVLECGVHSPYRDWYFFNPEFLDAGRPIEAWPLRDLPKIDHSESPWLTRNGDWSYRELGFRAWWDLPALPKLNTFNPEVREHLMQVAEHWIRFGADGWRLDVPDQIQDPTFWQEFRRRVKAVNAEAYIVAEIWSTDPEALRGDRYDALMNYPLGAALLSFGGAGRIDRAVADTHAGVGDFVHDDDAPTFAARLQDAVTVYPPEVTQVQLNVVDTHDTPRAITICSGDATAIRLVNLGLATLPGAPSLYYGSEIGLPGGFDPDCRRSFPWDHPETWDRRLLAETQAVMALRHAHPQLRRGDVQLLAAAGGAVAWARTLDGHAPLVVALNQGDAEATLELALPASWGATMLEALELPFDDLPAAVAVGDGGAVALHLPARAGRVLAVRGA